MRHVSQSELDSCSAVQAPSLPPRSEFVRDLLDSATRHRTAFWIPLTVVFIVGVAISLSVARKCSVTVEIARRSPPHSVNSDQHASPAPFDQKAISQQLLEPENLIRAIRAAAKIGEGPAASTNLSQRELMQLAERIAAHTQIRVADRNQLDQTIQIIWSGRSRSPVEPVLLALAEEFKKKAAGTSKADVRRDYEIARQAAEAAQHKASLLLNTHRWLLIDQEARDLDDQISTLQSQHYQLRQLRDTARPEEIRPTPWIGEKNRSVEDRWQALVELEKDLIRFDLSSTQRTHMRKQIDLIRAELNRTTSDRPTPSSISLTAISAMPAISSRDDGKLADIERQIAMCQARLAQCRERLSELELSISKPRDPSLTPAVLDRQCKLAKEQEGLALAKAEQLHGTLMDLEGEPAVAYGITIQPLVARTSILVLGLALAATCSLSTAAGFGAAWFAGTGNTSYRTMEEAKRHLNLPVFGIVPLSSPRPASNVEQNSKRAA